MDAPDQRPLVQIGAIQTEEHPTDVGNEGGEGVGVGGQAAFIAVDGDSHDAGWTTISDI